MTDILLGSVPSEWRVERLGQLFRERKEKVSDKEFAPLSVTKNGIVPQLDTAAKTDDGDNRKGVRAGDFVINSRSDRKGSSGLSELDGSVSLINIVLEPLRIHPRYAHHLLRSTAFQEEFYRWGHGIVADLWTTRYFDMKNIRIGIPGLETQKRIALFLDLELSRIDQLIKKKQEMLDLMSERSMSLVESSIVGEGPQTKLGHHVRILPGYAFASGEFSMDSNDIRLLRGVNVGVGTVRWDDVVYWPKSKEVGVGRFQLAEGDIVMGMDRPWISSGIRVAQIKAEDLPCLLLQRVCKIEALSSLDKRYMMLLLKSRHFLAHFEPILTGVSVPHISGDQIGAFRFSYLSLPEQRDRVVRCEKAIAHDESVAERVMKSIDRLRELRSSIITAVTTGQLDIATWQKRDMTNRGLDLIQAEAST